MKEVLITMVCVICICAVVAVVLHYFLQPKPLEKTAVNAARQKCKEYVDFGCTARVSLISNSNESSDISGGEVVKEMEYPHMALVLVNRGKSVSTEICGGTLISDKFVMTSAGCVYGVHNTDVTVRLGVTRWTDRSSVPVYDVEEVITHGSYDPDVVSTRKYDIALLKLSTWYVKFSPTIRPACLNTDDEHNSKPNYTTCGWGMRQDTKSEFVILRKIEQYANEEIQSDCSLRIQGFDKTYMICAANRNPLYGPCEGDSGGPLQFPFTIPPNRVCVDATSVQVGVSSNVTNSCSWNELDATSTVYIKVDQFLPWIVSHVWPEMLEK